MSVLPEPGTEAALDAYSRIVTAVAADLTPHVAALQVTGADGRAGAGSAVVFTPDGLLLTNAHVVARSKRGRAVFSDGTEADVDVVGADPLSDLAVVRARTGTPPPPALGAAGTLPGGRLVVGLGNPPGVAGGVSAGVVSWQGRSL
ncbi:S1C family serine protease, partial [Geodermatophilus sp. SYSU D00691]